MAAQKDPAWLTTLHLVLTVVTVALAVPAAMDGNWTLALGAFVTLIVLDLLTIVVVKRGQRRRRSRQGAGDAS
ncbi:hypothetical protein [Geodermatophilus maliterrae]|uniref:Uncharacterized protein n=1 Tax=Geodermatophilus maliterrae TaxID=3162531 RepID=A0ABV3XEI1_9ACTN